MALKVLDANNDKITLATRNVTNTRSADRVDGSFENGIAQVTEVYSLPEQAEKTLKELSDIIALMSDGSPDPQERESIRTTVDRVMVPNGFKTGGSTFNNPNERLKLTPQPIPDSENGKTMAYCDLKASSRNEGSIYVGDDQVNDSTGREMDPAEFIIIPISDLSQINVFSPNAGNKFSWIVYYEK